jgi:osmotically-inducible protein OsmY
MPTSPPLRTAMPSAALPGSGSADDAATATILSAIRADPGMAGSDVSVHTDNGVVTITGLVRNREQSAIASAYANRQLGVLRVDNQLSIPAQ